MIERFEIPRRRLCCFVIAMCVFLVSFSEMSFGQTEKETIQTEITLDQMVPAEETFTETSAETKAEEKKEPVILSFEEEKIMMINQSLKNAVEENRSLTEELEALKGEIDQLRGQREINSTRIDTLMRQRDTLRTRADSADKRSEEIAGEIEQLKNDFKVKEKEMQVQLDKVREDIAAEKAEEQRTLERVMPEIQKGLRVTSMEQQAEFKQKTQKSIADIEKTAHQTAKRLSRLNKENKKLKTDTAKIHYNLANIFFEQGRYAMAAKEYQKVVDMMPFDAAAHYNLAFVSGEFLNDYKTALKHYKEYLYLNPEAEDKHLVNEKILEAQLTLRSTIDSSLENEMTHMNRLIKNQRVADQQRY